MKLRDFLKLYNFRQMISDKQNTQIVRIHLDWPAKWFEFGVNDWDYGNDVRDKMVENILRPDLLDKEVVSINYDNDNSVFCIFLDQEES